MLLNNASCFSRWGQWANMLKIPSRSFYWNHRWASPCQHTECWERVLSSWSEAFLCIAHGVKGESVINARQSSPMFSQTIEIYQLTGSLPSNPFQNYSDSFFQKSGRLHWNFNNTVLILFKLELKTYFNILSGWDTKSVDKMTLR